jgi:aspartate aminotransferase
MILSTAASRIQGQPMFKVLDAVQRLEADGKSIIHFEIGDPDFTTPKHIIEACCDSLHDGETHYVNSMGTHDLRAVAAMVTQSSRGFLPDINQVLITPGANLIIYLATHCLVNPGEEVILPDPGFPTYRSVAALCGVKPVGVPLKESNYFRMNPEDVNEAVTKKTRLIIINSPNNPTGSVMKREEITAIYEIAHDKGICLLSDEVYARMHFGETPFFSPSTKDACKENVIVMNSVSKAFAMAGWRLGTAIGPEAVIERMGLLAQTLCSCTPPFVQRADLLVDGLNRLPGIHCLNSEGALYVFPNITGTGMTDREFSDFMLEKAGVALLPGTDFGEAGEGHVRLAFTTSEEKIMEGLRRMKQALEGRR